MSMKLGWNTVLIRKITAPTRSVAALLSIVAIAIAAAGCANPQGVETEVDPSVKFSNPWLAKNVAVEVGKAGRNERSGLYEVDASFRIEQLERGKLAGYRVVARTHFYDGGSEQACDTSAWSEVTLQPGTPSSYSCTSLKRATRHVIELAYPKEVGIK